MTKLEFIQHCVLQNRMTPADAMSLWKETQQAIWDDFRPDLSAPGPFLQSLCEALDQSADGTRRTLFALIRERYNERTGERR